MRRIASVAAVSLVAAGCGSSPPPDHTATFVACLQRSGGELVRSPAQLRSFPTADLQLGVGAGLDSISYFSIDASTGHRDERQSLVFVDDPRAPLGTSPMPQPAELLRRARSGQAHMRAVVAMRPAEDFDSAIGDCEDVAAPGEAVP